MRWSAPRGARLASFFLLATALLAPFARSAGEVRENFLLSPAELGARSPDDLSRAQALDDFAAFERLIREAYGGYDHFRVKGTDWDALFRESRRRIRDRKTWTLTAYFELLNEFIRGAGVSDGHLWLTARSPTLSLRGYPGLKRWTARFADVYVQKSKGRFLVFPRSSPRAARRELLGVEGRSPGEFLFPTYDPDVEGQLFLLGSFGERPMSELSCRFADGAAERLPLHPQRMTFSIENRPAFEFEIKDRIPLVSLRSLQPSHETDLARFAETADRLKDARAAVLDLRGCDGGNDGYGVRWVQTLSSGTVHTRITKRSRVSAVASAGEINEWLKILSETSDPEGRRHIEGYIEEAKARLRHIESTGMPPGWKTETFDLPGGSSTPFSGALIILSDRANGSACEGLMKVALSLSSAVVMGENSYGVSTFAPVNLYRLPNSKIDIQIGEAVSTFRGDISEGKGIAPDLWIDEPDPLPAALSYARGLLEKDRR